MKDAVSAHSHYHFDRMPQESATQSRFDHGATTQTRPPTRDYKEYANTGAPSETDNKPTDPFRYRYHKILDEFIDKGRPTGSLLKDSSHERGARDKNRDRVDQFGGFQDRGRDEPRGYDQKRADNQSIVHFERNNALHNKNVQGLPFKFEAKTSTYDPLAGGAYNQGKPEYEVNTQRRGRKRSDELSYEEPDYIETIGMERLQTSSKFGTQRTMDDPQVQGRHFPDRDAYQGTDYQTSSDLKFPSPTSNFREQGHDQLSKMNPTAKERGLLGRPVSGFDHTNGPQYSERGLSKRQDEGHPKKASNLASLIPNHSLAKHFGAPKVSSTHDTAFHHFRMRHLQDLQAVQSKTEMASQGVQSRNMVPADNSQPHYWHIKASDPEDADIKRILGKVRRAEGNLPSQNQKGNPEKGAPPKMTPSNFENKSRQQEKTSFNLSNTSPRSPIQYNRIEGGNSSRSHLQYGMPRPVPHTKGQEYSSNRQFTN